MTNFISHIIITLLMISASFSVNANDANSILANASNKLVNSKSISATFSLINNGKAEQGSITIAGDKFTITTDELSTWFDGKTQWTYSSSINEVNISEPTPEELQFINPFAIIKNFKTEFNAKLLSNTNGVHKVILTPKNKNASIKNIELSLNSSNSFPTLVVINATNNIKTTIKVKSIKTGDSLPISTFTFNTKNYPNIEIIDLR